MARGGSIVTVGVALLCWWWAFSGYRPTATQRGEAEQTKEISARERLGWAFLGAALIAYEVFKALTFVHSQR